MHFENGPNGYQTSASLPIAVETFLSRKGRIFFHGLKRQVQLKFLNSHNTWNVQQDQTLGLLLNWFLTPKPPKCHMLNKPCNSI